MIQRAAKHLKDAEDAVRLILNWTAEIDRAGFFADPMLRAAVEREATIFGEALMRLRRDDPATAARVPNLREAIGLRNALVHGYDTFDPADFWSTIVHDLPPFADALAALRAELEPD